MFFICLLGPEKEEGDPVVETKKPETVVEPVKAQVSGSSSNITAPTTQPSMPMINADFIQQFQNALHSIDGMTVDWHYFCQFL